MARPTVFVSSTYYDLKYLRAGIEAFVSNLGYEPVLFEKGAITFHHDQTLEQSCLQGVSSADMLVLIIGGRYGALSKEDEDALKNDPTESLQRIRSITNKEYVQARERDIPIFIFVENAVLSEYSTFKQNRDNESVKFVHVDDRRIYEMLDDVLGQRRNNFVKGFSNLEDITGWLRDQWSGIFAELIRKKNVDQKIKSLADQIADLTDAISTLKSYNEEIIRAVTKADSQAIIHRESKRTSTLRARRFKNEPLISFLADQLGPKSSSSQFLLDAFLSSKDLPSFLADNFTDKDAIEAFLAKHGGPNGQGSEDYSTLKERYDPTRERDDEAHLPEARNEGP
jgi:hypothetical protein